MVTALGMTIVMAVMAAMIAVNTQTAGIVAAIMLFLYEAFYAWGFMGPIWVSSHLFNIIQSPPN
jgi:hypothetical protein